jgi:hypothetical protein
MTETLQAAVSVPEASVVYLEHATRWQHACVHTTARCVRSCCQHKLTRSTTGPCTSLSPMNKLFGMVSLNPQLPAR